MYHTPTDTEPQPPTERLAASLHQHDLAGNDSEWQREFAFPSQRLTLPSGYRYHYVDCGSGPPMLMVHGNPTWSFYWRRLIDHFRDRHRAIAVDHIGCGLSDKPQRYSYNLATHIDNLDHLVRHLDLNDMTLVVHDWGGPIGLGAAVRWPQRIARLVILNTGAFPPPYVPLRIRLCRTPLVGTWAIRQCNLFARAATRMATQQRGGLPRAAREGLLAPYNSWDNRVAIDRFVRDIPLTPRHPTWSVLQQLESGLRGFPQRPVQLIWGMRDWCFRVECLRRMHDIFPQAQVCRIEDAGHYVMEDAPDQVCREIEQV